MSNHYQCLKVSKDAPFQAIEAAYHQLAKKYHPEKNCKQAEVFMQLQNAYDVLHNLDKRIHYDTVVLKDPDNVSKWFAKEMGTYALTTDDPHTFDHYAYYNRLFGLEDDEQLAPGKPFSNFNFLYNELVFLSETLQKEQNSLNNKRYQRQLNGKDISKHEKQRLELINRNVPKMDLVQLALFENKTKNRQLYDLTLGYQDTTLSQIANQIGTKVISKLILENPEMDFTNAIFALHEACCLTLSNVKQFIYVCLIPGHRENTTFGKPVDFEARSIARNFSSLAGILVDLQNNKLLNQANFDFLIKYAKKNFSRIECGISQLELAKILNERYFKIIVDARQDAKNTGYLLGTFQEFSLLNEENIQIVESRKLSYTKTYPPLAAMRKAGQLTPEKTVLLFWDGTPELKPLNHWLNTLFAHGLFLLSSAPDLGMKTMQLSLTLKAMLKEYMELDGPKKQARREQFSQAFITCLHNEDKFMVIHREPWKIIVANLLIALTGIGLLALGTKYLLTGNCFFAQTKRETLLAHIENKTKNLLQTN